MLLVLSPLLCGASLLLLLYNPAALGQVPACWNPQGAEVLLVQDRNGDNTTHLCDEYVKGGPCVIFYSLCS